MMYSILAAYYDDLMDLDYAAYLADWQELVDFTGQDVFEFGCGTANMTRLLVPLVNSIDAADASPEMLSRAGQKVQSPKVRFFLADEDFTISRRYHKIGLFIDVVNYLAPQELAGYLRRWYDWLHPEGEIIFDVSTEDKLAGALGQQIFYYDTPDGELYWHNEYDPSARRLDFSLIFYQAAGEGLYSRREEYHTQYVYREADIRQLAPDYDVSRYPRGERDYYILRKTACKSL